MHTALLSRPDLPLQARRAHIFPWITKALLSIGKLCEHGCEDTFNDKYVHIKNKQSGKIIMRVTRDARTTLYMLNLTQQKKLMMYSTTPDKYLQGTLKSENQKAHWWNITTHAAGSPLILDRRKQSQKTYSLFGQAYHWT